MKQGAVDYIAKPFDHAEMLQRISEIFEKQSHKHEAEPETAMDTINPSDNGFNGILGQCDTMKLLFRQIRKVAPTDATVLIQGSPAPVKSWSPGLFMRTVSAPMAR